MRKCVDRTTPASYHLPITRTERYSLLDQFGDEAFLFPEGTPASSQPSYPVLTREGCFHCGLGRAAYTRLGQAYRLYPKERKEISAVRKKLIRKALHSGCKWAHRASKRYNV